MGENDAPSISVNHSAPPFSLLLGLPPSLFLLACRPVPIKQAGLDSKANLLEAMQINPPWKTKVQSVLFSEENKGE